MKSTEQEVIRLLKHWLKQSQFQGKCFAIGGFVRDEILGIDSKDLDLVIEEKGGAKLFCEWLHKKAPLATSKPRELGAGYPIWQIVFKENVEIDEGIFETQGCEVEVADTQSEAFPDPNTRQRITRFGSLEEDCKRRDFTVNMLYRDLSSGALLDLSQCGQSDIENGLLRGHPEVDLEKIFSDDPLRMLRLIRFHCRFGWKIEQTALEKMRKCADRVKILSVERIRDELIKILLTGNFHLGLDLMQRQGLLAHIFNEALPMIGCTQDSIYHAEGDVWVHTLLVVKNAPASIPLQLAAFCHDLGKPQTRSEHGDRVKFLGHEVFSTSLTESLLTRLKFDSNTIRKVKNLVKLHLRGSDVAQWSSLKPARKLMRDAGEDLEELLLLIEADSKSSLSSDGSIRIEHVAELRKKLDLAGKIPLSSKSLLNGNDIMEALKFGPGKAIQDVQKFVEGLQDDYAEQGIELGRDLALEEIRKHFLKSNSN